MRENPSEEFLLYLLTSFTCVSLLFICYVTNSVLSEKSQNFYLAFAETNDTIGFDQARNISSSNITISNQTSMDGVETLYIKGYTVSNLGRYEEAISYYDKVLSLKPESLRGLASKGNALSELGLYEDAIAYYDKALAVDPSAIGVVHNKAFALFNLGRYEEAL